MTHAIRWRGQTLICRLRIQPRAGQNAFAGRVGDRLKVRIQSAPVDGQANASLIAFLARQCGVAKSSVRLCAGAASRDKVVEIDCPARLPEALRVEMRLARPE